MTSTNPDKCDHGVKFDERVAKNLDTYRVRALFPRGFFTPESPCPHCGFIGIVYASTAHYVYGDW